MNNMKLYLSNKYERHNFKDGAAVFAHCSLKTGISIGWKWRVETDKEFIFKHFKVARIFFDKKRFKHSDFFFCNLYRYKKSEILYTV